MIDFGYDITFALLALATTEIASVGRSERSAV